MFGMPTFWWHVVQVIIGITILAAITFQITRTTSSQRVEVKAGGVANYYWKDAQVKTYPGGCQTIHAEKPPVK